MHLAVSTRGGGVGSISVAVVSVSKHLKRWGNVWDHAQLSLSEFHSLKLLGHDCVFAAAEKAEDTGGQFGAVHNLDASSVSSNIPWKPKLPTELLLVAHAYFMKSEAD